MPLARGESRRPRRLAVACCVLFGLRHELNQRGVMQAEACAVSVVLLCLSNLRYLLSQHASCRTHYVRDYFQVFSIAYRPVKVLSIEIDSFLF